jgi:hypothetical protein
MTMKTRLSAATILLATTLSCGAAKADPALQAAPGVTAISGQILDQQSHGLAHVQILAGAANTQTDQNGRFLLSFVPPGQTVLQIDARHAGAMQTADHGFYELAVQAKPGQTTPLPGPSWLPLLDHAHDVTITNPTSKPFVITNPSLPGLELRIPAGVTIKDVDGAPVTRIGITVMPRTTTPMKLPDRTDLAKFFTIQPGAACLYDATGHPAAARLVYPANQKQPPGARIALWRYDPAGFGWYIYGIGVVTADGKQIRPDDKAAFSNFDSAECDATKRTRKTALQLSSGDVLKRLMP